MPTRICTHYASLRQAGLNLPPRIVGCFITFLIEEPTQSPWQAPHTTALDVVLFRPLNLLFLL